ncbi:hypothetical protein [Streptomyces albidoflavus]|uniref:hypothetical protein n=1 Tax=Streptomyces albidoflavus TaxID=1886 RepID=UPI001E36B8BD|nr:hypothetical protein [Streptomyces albidoflavus]
MRDVLAGGGFAPVAGALVLLLALLLRGRPTRPWWRARAERSARARRPRELRRAADMATAAAPGPRAPASPRWCGSPPCGSWPPATSGTRP